VTQNCGAKAQGVLGGEGGVGEDASGAVRSPHTNPYTYILTRPRALEGIARVGRKREAGYELLTALGMDARGRLALGYAHLVAYGERGFAGLPREVERAIAARGSGLGVLWRASFCGLGASRG
jgi:hypothetical protein